MIVLWRIAERCNFACAFCACSRDLPHARREADPAEVRRFASLLAAYSQTTGERVLLSWLGGEPLLWHPLTAVTEFCARDLQLPVSTTTNGSTLSSSRVRAHLLEHYTELTVSVDGFASFHDAIRGFAGSFAGLQRNVTVLAEEKRRAARGPRLRANVVLMRDNLSDFPALCRELARWGIEEITFNQLGGRDRPEFYPDHRLRPVDVAHLAHFLPNLRRELASHGVALSGSESYLRRFGATSRGDPLPIADCHPGESFLFIEADGRAAPCSFSVDAYGVNTREIEALHDLRALPLRFANARRERRIVDCDDCHSTQVFAKFAS